MMTILTFALLITVQLASAHFALKYPEWRANSLTNASYSQYVYPCAGVPWSAGNRTDWPLTGGSLKLDLHHPWSYVFVNLGLGENVTNFNYTLTQNFWNETGNGTLCVPSLALPPNLVVTDGTKASIQVVTSGTSGSALYNCADITFRATAFPLNSSECTNDPGVSYFAVNQEFNGSTQTNSTTSTSNSTTGDPGKSAASATGISMSALTSVVGLTLVFVFALG